MSRRAARLAAGAVGALTAVAITLPALVAVLYVIAYAPEPFSSAMQAVCVTAGAITMTRAVLSLRSAYEGKPE